MLCQIQLLLYCYCSFLMHEWSDSHDPGIEDWRSVVIWLAGTCIGIITPSVCQRCTIRSTGRTPNHSMWAHCKLTVTQCRDQMRTGSIISRTVSAYPLNFSLRLSICYTTSNSGPTDLMSRTWKPIHLHLQSQACGVNPLCKAWLCCQAVDLHTRGILRHFSSNLSFKSTAFLKTSIHWREADCTATSTQGVTNNVQWADLVTAITCLSFKFNFESR